MKVHDLQGFLAGVIPFAKAAGASEKAAAELDRALQCLEPFKERTLAEFNEFLHRADEFDRTGKLTPPAKTAKPRTPKAPVMTVDAAAQIFKDVLARAVDPKTTYAEIDDAFKPMDKMTVAQLVELAVKVDVAVPSKPKGKILEGLKRRVTELKASAERTQHEFGA